MNRKLDVIRLGEYDYNLNSDEEDALHIDFSPGQIIFHPLYKAPSAYHDLALVKLNETIHPTFVSVKTRETVIINFCILSFIIFLPLGVYKNYIRRKYVNIVINY